MKVLLAIALLALAVPAAQAEPTEPSRHIGYGQIRFNGKGPEAWALRYREKDREADALRSQLRKRYRPTSLQAIYLACTAYHVDCRMMVRKADCETGGTFSPYARNKRSNASGLFQFLPSTFASTPYAGFSIWDPYANALAAGWMHANGRGGEWECR